MTQRINKKVLRREMAVRGIFSIAELARRVPCSRWSVYAAMDHGKCPQVRNRIKEITNV